ANAGEAALDRGHDLGGIVDRQRRLGHDRERLARRDLDALDVVDVFDEVDAAIELAHGALDLGVSLVADHDELIALARQLGHLHVDLAHQRAGRIEDREASFRRLLAHRLRHAVGAEDERRARRHLAEVLDEDRAFVLEVVDDVGVVDDLVADVDRRAELVERALDDLDRAIDAGAEAARLGEDDFLQHYRTPISFTSNVTARPASGWLKSKTSASPSMPRTTPAIDWPSGAGKRTTSPTR